jgi:hypothetical protein
MQRSRKELEARSKVTAMPASSKRRKKSRDAVVAS